MIWKGDIPLIGMTRHLEVILLGEDVWLQVRGWPYRESLTRETAHQHVILLNETLQLDELLMKGSQPRLSSLVSKLQPILMLN
jgi:hypothetical protein